MWLISRDRGFPEIWQYGKEAAIVAMLTACHRRLRSAVHLAWSAVFAYFLIDDSLEVHETLGEAIAGGLGLDQPFGIEGRDAGQILVSASVGLLLVAIVAGTTLTDRTPARRLTGRLLPVLAAIGFFGVVADVIDVIDVLGLVEDCGEMTTMTVAVAIVANHWWAGAPAGDVEPSIPSGPVPGDSTQPIESVDPSTS